MSRVTIVAGLLFLTIAIVDLARGPVGEWTRTGLPIVLAIIFIALGLMGRFGRSRKRVLGWALGLSVAGFLGAVLEQRITVSVVAVAYFVLAVRWQIRARRKRRQRGA